MAYCFSCSVEEYYVEESITELVVALLDLSQTKPRVLKNLKISSVSKNKHSRDLYNFSNPREEKITVSKTSPEIFHKGSLTEMKNHGGLFPNDRELQNN